MGHWSLASNPISPPNPLLLNAYTASSFFCLRTILKWTQPTISPINPMTVKQKRSPKEIEDSLDFSFRELCKGPLIIWCSLLIYVLVLVFTDLPILLVYVCFLVAIGLLPPFFEFVISSFELRFQEKRSRLDHWQKNGIWLKP